MSTAPPAPAPAASPDGSPDSEALRLLRRWQGGDIDARDALFALLHSDLSQISAHLLRAERSRSLAVGDLVNEAAIRLLKADGVDWDGKSHFLALAAKAMRQVLVDRARKRGAAKREHQRVTLLTEVHAPGEPVAADQLEKALIRLAAIDPSKAEIVELRYYGGLSAAQVGEVTGCSESTVKREWRVARAWLLDALNGP